MSSSKTPKVNKAFSVERGPAGWSVVEYEIQGSKIVSKVVSEPDLRALALERLATSIGFFWEME